MARDLVSFDSDEAGGAREGPPAWLLPVLIMVAAVHAALFVYVLWADTILKPYSDEYALLSDAFAWRDGQVSFLSYLWQPHVGHHAVWVRLLTAWEAASIHNAWPSVAAAAVALISSAGLLGWSAWRDARLSALRLPSALACAMLMLTGFAALDAAQPINALYPFCVVFALASLMLFEASAPGVPGEAVRRVLALALAMASALGNGAGLALWPVLLLAAATQPRRPWLWSGIVAVVGGLFAFAYLSGAGEVAQLAGGAAGVDDGVGRRMLYFLDYISLPWSQLSTLAGAGIGAALLGLSAWSIRLARLRGLTQADRFAMALIVFSLGTAALAALGRGGAGEILRAPMRYVIFATLFHVGLVMLLAPEVERFAKGRAPALAVAALAALLVQQAAAVPLAAGSSGRIKAVIAAYETGARTPDMVPLIYPDLAFAGRIDDRLAREHAFGKPPLERTGDQAAPPGAALPSAGGRTP